MSALLLAAIATSCAPGGGGGSDGSPIDNEIADQSDDHPGVVLVRTRYTSTDRELEVEAIIEHDFESQPVNGPDRRNEQPLNGGVPYCDIWIIPTPALLQGD